MKTAHFFLAGVLTLFGTQTALAGNCAQFSASDINVTYDPLGSQGVTQVVQPISLRAARGFSSPHSSAVLAVQGQFVDEDSTYPLRIGTRGPIYTIEGPNTVSVNRTAAPLMPNQYFTYAFQDHNPGVYENVHGLQFFIDPGQDVPAGVYSETLDMQFHCYHAQEGHGTADWQSGVLHVTVDVPSKLIANLSGGSKTGTLDFGDFTQHVRGAMVNVYSTGPFSVSIASDNYGRMVLDGTARPDHESEIPYSVFFDGFPYVGYTMHFPRTGIGGAGFPLAVAAGNTHGKRAGIYRDVLTVTITPTAF